MSDGGDLLDISDKSVSQVIDEIIGNKIAEGLVRHYFDPARGFAGYSFDCLGDNPPGCFSEADLLAVSLLLDRPLPPTAVLTLLEKPSDITDLLAAVPADKDIWDTDIDIAPGSAADELWSRLCLIKGVGPVKAGKLMARKRPRLIPIVDKVVRNALVAAGPGNYWASFKVALDDDSRRARIKVLRPADENCADISILRLLDVAIWMIFSQSQGARTSREELSANLLLSHSPEIG